MTEKLNFRTYQGDRIRVPIVGCLNIRRIYCWNKLLSKYVDPKRGGRYEARRSRGLNQEREMKYFDCLQDARDWQTGRNFKPSHDSSFAETQASSGYCVEHLLNDWQRLWWPELRPTTRIFYSKLIKHFEPLFGTSVEALMPRHIDEWLGHLRSPEYAKHFRKTRHTLEKEFDCFKAMVRWYIEVNDECKLVSPFKKRHMKMLKVRDKPTCGPKYMSAEELERWLQILKSDSVFFWALALTQVRQILRISEVASMKWSNLELKTRSYRVSEHMTWPRVKGQAPAILPGTKTNKSGELFTIYLREEVLSALTELSTLPRKGELVFSLDGGPLDYRQIQYRFNKAFEKAGLPYRSTHVLRHTGATEFLNETGDLLALQQMGNWADVRMATHYGKILNTRAREAIDRIERRKVLRLIRPEKEDKAL